MRDTRLYTSCLTEYALFNLEAEAGMLSLVSTSDQKFRQGSIQTRPVCQSSLRPMHSAGDYRTNDQFAHDPITNPQSVIAISEGLHLCVSSAPSAIATGLIELCFLVLPGPRREDEPRRTNQHGGNAPTAPPVA